MVTNKKIVVVAKHGEVQIGISVDDGKKELAHNGWSPYLFKLHRNYGAKQQRKVTKQGVIL